MIIRPSPDYYYSFVENIYTTNTVKWMDGYDQMLPASLYLTGKLAFFGANPPKAGCKAGPPLAASCSHR